ncbi:MAG TPA: hypothetical protein VEU47_01680 [Candidatus Cybelea sp.]|nr:hypothetical protein [Candidatus Cybelea sp.]
MPPRSRVAPPQLAGLTASEVTQVLGVPGLQRHEPSAEVWQYQGSSCVLFVFLYQDPARDTAARQASTEPHADRREWRVTYAEALARGDGHRVPAQECLNGLIDRRPLTLGLN